MQLSFALPADRTPGRFGLLAQRRCGGECFTEHRGHTFPGIAAITQLGALGGGSHSQDRATIESAGQVAEDTVLLGVAKRVRSREIKGKLYSTVRGIDVLATGTGGAGKAFAELGLGNDEAVGDTGTGDDLQAVHDVDASGLAATVGRHPAPCRSRGERAGRRFRRGSDITLNFSSRIR